MNPVLFANAVRMLLADPRFNPNADFIYVVREAMGTDIAYLAKAGFGNPLCVRSCAHHVERNWLASVLLYEKGKAPYGWNPGREAIAYPSGETFTW